MQIRALSLSALARAGARQRASVVSLWVVGAWLAVAAVPGGTLGLTPAQAQQTVPADQGCPAPSAPQGHAATAPARGEKLRHRARRAGGRPPGPAARRFLYRHVAPCRHSGIQSEQPQVVTGANPGKAEMPQKPC